MQNETKRKTDKDEIKNIFNRSKLLRSLIMFSSNILYLDTTMSIKYLQRISHVLTNLILKTILPFINKKINKVCLFPI